MAQSENYDLQAQRMTSAQKSNGKICGRFDLIHVVLAVLAIIFLILSIVFIILFATKQDTSSGFLTTGFSDSKPDDVYNELRGLLNSKYTVNSFASDVENKAVSAVFSLRNSVSADDVERVLSGSKLVTQMKTTYGDDATSVCRQVQNIPQTTIIINTTTTTTTTSAPADTKYCKGTPIPRDIVILVDMNILIKNNQTEKMASLNSIRQNLVNNIVFSQANVFLKAAVDKNVIDVSTGWISDSNQLNEDFAKLLGINPLYNKTDFNYADAFEKSLPTFKTGREFVPVALFVITDKPRSQDSVTTNLKDFGIFVGVTGVRESYLNQANTIADQVIPQDSWTKLANQDPFQTLMCSFYKPSNDQMSSRSSLSEYDDQTNATKCEVLDIILAFDTSESMSTIIVPLYVAFAKQFVAQYKYKENDYSRVGVITFTNEVTEVLELVNGNNLNDIDAAINSVHYTGGLTDVTLALNKSMSIFQRDSDASRSKVLIVLSDGVPTVDSYSQEVVAGATLKQMGVAVFFVGYSSYTDQVKAELGNVTNPSYVYGDMSNATFDGMTNQILIAYPCPIPECVTAFYAIEISEATDSYVVQNLKDILDIASKAHSLQNGAESYELVTYNDVGNTKFHPQGNHSFDAFKSYVQGLIDNQTEIFTLRQGNTVLDKAIDDITVEMKTRVAKNRLFQANIIFFGQANNGVLSPNMTIGDRNASLTEAANGLNALTNRLIFVVDNSRDETYFSDDLWSSVTSKSRIIKNSTNNEHSLETTDYFTTWSTLSCVLPPFIPCYDTPLDVAVIIDLQNEDPAFLSYITTLLNQFSFQDDTHVSLLAYGAQPTTVLSPLNGHSSQDIQNFKGLYAEWYNGSYFDTTTTTEAPTSSTTQRSPMFWSNQLYQVNGETMTGVFSSLGTQFGCGHYSDDGDRIFAPNLFIFASDNFQNYADDVWNVIRNERDNRYGCKDCAATPSFLFLSRSISTVVAPSNIGPTFYLSDTDLDIDATDNTSISTNFDNFNYIVYSICSTSLPSCATYISTCGNS